MPDALSDVATAAPVAIAKRRRAVVSQMLRRLVLGIALASLFGLFSVLLPSTFPTHGNIESMLSSQSFVLVIALAVTIPLRAGDFDLSIAAVMVFAGAVLGLLVTQGHWPLAPAIVVCLAIGLGIGLFNAIFIVKLGINAFIVTLGTMTAIGGATFGVTNSNIVSSLPNSLLELGQTTILGLPSSVLYGWVLALILWYVFEFTPYGRRLLFVGGNADAARLAGVRVDRIRMSAFVLSGGLSALGGLVLAANIGAIDPSESASFLLPPYAAAFLGTTTLQIGRFNVLGTVIGSYLLTVGITGLELAGASSWVTDVFDGGALIVAVTFASLAVRRA